MRRPALPLALLALALGVSAQSALTASNAMPNATAVYRATTVSGATAVSMKYTMTGDAITTVRARLQKVDLLLTTVVQARFGSDAAVLCTTELITVVDVLTNLGEAEYTCPGFTEDADRPRALMITVS